MEKIIRHWYARWWVIVLFIVLFLFLILAVSSVFYIMEILNRADPGGLAVDPAAYDDPDLKRIVEGENSYWLGAANPRLTIVQFADFSCPLCVNSFTTLREISLTYKETVKIIHRDYPVVSDHSAGLALAARCAGEQGLFWPMHDRLYIRQGLFAADDLVDLARQTGADPARFAACLDNETYLTLIQKDYDDGRLLGVAGTPTWFFNGARIEGDIPYDVFINIIENSLKN